MPDLQSQTAPATPQPAFGHDLAVVPDADFALGCECADPMLQIERWQQETAQALAGPDAQH